MEAYKRFFAYFREMKLCRHRTFILLLLFLLSSVILHAGNPAEKPRGFSIFLSMSPYPAMYSLGHTYSPVKSGTDMTRDFGILYNRSRYSMKMSSLGTYTLGVDFFTGTLFSIALSASFETERISIRENLDNSLYFSSNQSFIVPMISVRANWFNRPAVRLYSYAGLGRWMRISTFGEIKEDNRKTDSLGLEYEQDTKGTAYHICPIGVSYGKKRVTVFAELGYGTRCCIGQLGVSCRLGKNK